VTKKFLADAGMNGIEVFSLGTLDWGENPRDVAMVDVAKELGYDLSGTTTVMTREKLMEADAVIVFEERHRDAITRVLDYSHWNRIVLFNKIALDENGNVEDPHYQTATVYRNVAKHIEDGCKRMVEQWKLQPPKPKD
jgi:protein-tyrosine phosphatase